MSNAYQRSISLLIVPARTDLLSLSTARVSNRYVWAVCELRSLSSIPFATQPHSGVRTTGCSVPYATPPHPGGTTGGQPHRVIASIAHCKSKAKFGLFLYFNSSVCIKLPLHSKELTKFLAHHRLYSSTRECGMNVGTPSPNFLKIGEGAGPH